jgi:hypothetical protein
MAGKSANGNFTGAFGSKVGVALAVVLSRVAVAAVLLGVFVLVSVEPQAAKVRDAAIDATMMTKSLRVMIFLLL